MKARILPIALVAALALGGCATLRSAPPDRNATVRLDRGLEALDAGAYRAAFDDLAWVYSRCQGREAGRRAMAAMAALELDLRNSVARPGVGLELLGEFVRAPSTEAWIRPLAESAFLGHLALGAPHPVTGPEPALVADTLAEAGGTTEPGHGAPAKPRDTEPASAAARAPATPPQEIDDGPVRGCGQAVAWGADSTMALPRLPGPSVAALLMQTDQEREALALRSDSLQTLVTTLREQLEATRAELERIRKTLKP